MIFETSLAVSKKYIDNYGRMQISIQNHIHNISIKKNCPCLSSDKILKTEFNIKLYIHFWEKIRAVSWPLVVKKKKVVLD